MSFLMLKKLQRVPIAIRIPGIGIPTLSYNALFSIKYTATASSPWNQLFLWGMIRGYLKILQIIMVLKTTHTKTVTTLCIICEDSV